MPRLLAKTSLCRFSTMFINTVGKLSQDDLAIGIYLHLEHTFLTAMSKKGQLWLIAGISVMSGLSQNG